MIKNKTEFKLTFFQLIFNQKSKIMKCFSINSVIDILIGNPPKQWYIVFIIGSEEVIIEDCPVTIATDYHRIDAQMKDRQYVWFQQ